MRLLNMRLDISPMDEKRGRLLLDEILEGGNFGQHSVRQHYGRGTLGHNIQQKALCGRSDILLGTE